MRLLASTFAGMAALAAAGSSFAQYPPQQPYPPPQQQPYPPQQQYPQQPPPGYSQPYPQQQYPQQQPPPGYGQPPPNGYNQPPPGYYQGPPPPREPPPAECCTMSIRINPLDLIFQRISLEFEYALIGPISIEADPLYIFGSPGSTQDGYKATGYGIRGALGVWFQGHALRGWFGKALVQYQSLSYSSTGSDDSFSMGWASYGLMIGSQTVFGRDGGFTISGGIGALATPNAPGRTLVTGANDLPSPGAKATCGSETRVVQSSNLVCVGPRSVDVIGQLALGYTF